MRLRESKSDMWRRLTSLMILSSFAMGLLFRLGESTSFGYARWSLWSSWAPCSRTCGGGISSRTRTCQPGGHEGSRCSGNFVQHKLCNKQKCPTGSVNSAEAQCSQYNNKDVFGHSVRHWVPDNNHKKNACELRCRSEDSSLSYSFGKMANGTACMADGVCFRGRCTKLGCDDILGSQTSRDMCAICGGRNLSCVQVQQMYSSTNGNFHDYNPVTVIPAGATNVRVQEHTKNFLALLERTPLNLTSDARFVPHIPGELQLGGTVFTYSMAPDHNESFSALGPTTGPLTLMTFLTQSGGQEILYEYWIPKELTTNRRATLGRTTTKATSGFKKRQPSWSRTERSHPDETKVTTDVLRDDPEVTTGRVTLDNRIPLPPLGKEKQWRKTSKVQTPLLMRTDSASSALSLPDKRHRKKPKKPRKKPRKQRPGSCPRCHRIKNQLENYCSSDLAAHVKILSVEPMERGEVRYDVAVLESFRNVFALQQREFLWSPNATCPCPKLSLGDEYVVMGHLQSNYRRKESRLVVNDKSFVRRFNDGRQRQLRRLRRRRNQKCNRTL
ncbi:ADAMTS-like protein 5 isoform X2 [Ornithodoros turicata]|uniref:ADAMTS-like protein 5 isoform X2 n=1 Tax=Ornithodoros turicata TaxID=34597 RepID=UPI00313988B5